ncbi:MAG: ParB/RepB/Spo0J family partition protein [Bradymonadales bacterium]|nr:MAG: ParB/RepB/Spo0J family partition protein [Bradymonadales bacterium]
METTQQSGTRSVLGRGIGSLLPESNNKRGYILCPIGELYPNHAQPRKHFDQEKLEELAQSIREKGVLQPILAKKTDKGYVIIAGERRWRASQLAGKTEVPVIVKELSDHEILELALIENIQREDLNPIEEAESYQRLIIDLGLTQEEVSQRVGKDRSTIANALRLLKLSKEVREKLMTGELSVGHARALIVVEDKSIQNKIMKEILEKAFSVRQVEALVKKVKSTGDLPTDGPSEKRLNEKTASEFEAVQDELRRILETRVEIKAHDSGRGQIQIQYLTRDDFNRIVDKIRNGHIR